MWVSISWNLAPSDQMKYKRQIPRYKRDIRKRRTEAYKKSRASVEMAVVLEKRVL